jgi:hypothetical protein
MSAMINGATKDELIVKIAQKIAASERLDPNWKSLSMVFTFDDDSLSNFGYYYTGDGPSDWSAFSSRSDQLDDDLVKLRQVMKEESKASWHQGLFQLLRDEREMKFEFAYDGETRWKVTPANLDQVVQELRPRAR